MNKLFIVLLCSLLVMTACGGGGGGSGDPLVVTPLSSLDDSSVTGTYSIISMNYLYTDMSTFTTDDLALFSGEMTIDFANEWVAYYFDLDGPGLELPEFDEFSLSAVDPAATWDNAYYDITGSYTASFFYDNLCTELVTTEVVCADVEVKIQKTSDTVATLFAGQISPASISADSVLEPTPKSPSSDRSVDVITAAALRNLFL